MRAPRISIAGVMTFVMFLSFTFAALHASTEAWGGAMLSLAIASYGVALLGLLFTRGRVKAMWAGYFIFGVGSLMLSIGPWCDEHIMPHLVTTPFIDDRYLNLEYTPKRVGERVWTSDGTDRGFFRGKTFGELDDMTIRFNVVHDRGTTSLYDSSRLRAISPDGHRRLCHSVSSLFIALLGALLARSFAGHHETRAGGSVPGVA